MTTENDIRRIVMDSARAIYPEIEKLYASQTGANAEQAKEIADLIKVANERAVDEFFKTLNLASAPEIKVAILATGAMAVAQTFEELAKGAMFAAAMGGGSVGIHVAKLKD